MKIVEERVCFLCLLLHWVSIFKVLLDTATLCDALGDLLNYLVNHALDNSWVKVADVAISCLKQSLEGSLKLFLEMLLHLCQIRRERGGSATIRGGAPRENSSLVMVTAATSAALFELHGLCQAEDDDSLSDSSEHCVLCSLSFL